jgi:hypothetical protein
MKNTYAPREFGKLIGRSVITRQKWDCKGVVKAHRSPTNRRYYTHKQYLVQGDVMRIPGFDKPLYILPSDHGTAALKDYRTAWRIDKSEQRRGSQ